MTQGNRLAKGGRIDRSKSLEFTFDGKRYQGYQGDTVASALLANGVHMVGRSWKYHRPRGIIGMGVEEPNALLQLETGAHTIPNPRATHVELYKGLNASSVNRWPSLDFDVNAAIGLVSKLFPAGFYYKTFKWPPKLWMTYERFIRKAAGLGVSPQELDPDHYDKMNAHCDVLVVGSGPTGLAAALAAGRAGARVILVDEQNEFGGSLLGSRDTIDGSPASEWVTKAIKELSEMKEVRLLPHSTAFGYYDHNFLGIHERLTDHLPINERKGVRQRVWRVRARQVVLATGAIERTLVFCNNDRPGIMLASAVSTYVNRYAVAPGSRAVVFTNNDSAYQTALDLLDAGIEVAAVVDVRREPRGALPKRVKDKGVEIIAGSAVTDAQGAKRIKGVEVMRLNGTGDKVEGSPRNLPCDLLAMSGGWSPAVHLFAQSGGKTRWDDDKVCFVPGQSLQQERSAGAANGNFQLSECLTEGFTAGAKAAQTAGFGDGSIGSVPSAQEESEEPIQPMWMVPARKPISRSPKQFIDYQNDVGSSDIALAHREGYRSVEHVKRYTAMGFGTDQGKVGNINGMAILAKLRNESIPQVGTTTFRPVYTPVTFGAMGGSEQGDMFEPIRKTAMHQWHEEHGAEFEDVGQWKRPWYYPKKGESMHDALNRECQATRNSLGILDASTLGKIDVQGPDAVTFLNWVYTNAWDNLKVGRCRYGVMLNENGMIMDDGVTSRLGENHYLMTTTSGGAARVLTWLERWLQTEWPELKVYLTSVTDHWATLSIAGPNSRKLMQELCDDIDFSAKAFPFMAFKEGTMAGVPARVFRISFTGELSYEVNVPANYGRYVWDKVMEAGAKYDITPYGTETMHVLRAEKGYIIVGQDTDLSMTPGDMAMDWIVSKKKDFLGRRSLSRADTTRADRKQFVGLLTENPTEVLPEGAQLVNDPSAPIPMPMVGHVTSSYYSATLGRSIALAVVKGGHKRMDEHVYAPLADGRTIKAKIANPVFYDPEGARQNV